MTSDNVSLRSLSHMHYPNWDSIESTFLGRPTLLVIHATTWIGPSYDIASYFPTYRVSCSHEDVSRYHTPASLAIEVEATDPHVCGAALLNTPFATNAKCFILTINDRLPTSLYEQVKAARYDMLVNCPALQCHHLSMLAKSGTVCALNYDSSFSDYFFPLPINELTALAENLQRRARRDSKFRSAVIQYKWTFEHFSYAALHDQRSVFADVFPKLFPMFKAVSPTIFLKRFPHSTCDILVEVVFVHVLCEPILLDPISPLD